MLPVPYYSEPSLETWDMRGNLVNDPRELIECGGGVTITFEQYQKLLEEAYVKLLTRKAYDWKYEQEVRLIFDVRFHAETLLFENDQFFLNLPPSAVKEVIAGFRASFDLIKTIVDCLEKGLLGAAKLYYATPHQQLYEVQANESEPKYMLDYYGIVKGNQP
jgi:hypothetical protein